MDISAFEHYIEVDPARVESHTVDGLAHYMTQFMKHIPFEDIHVQNGVPISTDVETNFDKIVHQHRGGFCYELNTLSQYYLKAKGYTVGRLAATVYTPEGDFVFKDSHLTTYVKLDGSTYLVDVGFGNASTVPVPLTGEVVDDHHSGLYRVIKRTTDDYEMQQKVDEASPWKTQYSFDFIDRPIDYFDEVTDKNQHDPASGFVQNLVVSRLTEEGRYTMSQHHLTITDTSGQQKLPVTSDNYREILKDYFDIDETVKTLEPAND